MTTVGETTQYLAVGDLSGSGTVQDLTSRVKWQSSDVSVATIDQNGLATIVGASAPATATTITAIASAANGSVLTATGTLNSSTGGGSVTLPTLAVYEVGAGAAQGVSRALPTC